MANPNRAMANLPKNPAIDCIRALHATQAGEIANFIKSKGGKARASSRMLGPRGKGWKTHHVHVFNFGATTREEVCKEFDRI